MGKKITERKREVIYLAEAYSLHLVKSVLVFKRDFGYIAQGF